MVLIICSRCPLPSDRGDEFGMSPCRVFSVYLNTSRKMQGCVHERRGGGSGGKEGGAEEEEREEEGEGTYKGGLFAPQGSLEGALCSGDALSPPQHGLEVGDIRWILFWVSPTLPPFPSSGAPLDAALFFSLAASSVLGALSPEAPVLVVQMKPAWPHPPGGSQPLLPSLPWTGPLAFGLHLTHPLCDFAKVRLPEDSFVSGQSVPQTKEEQPGSCALGIQDAAASSFRAPVSCSGG